MPKKKLIYRVPKIYYNKRVITVFGKVMEKDDREKGIKNIRASKQKPNGNSAKFRQILMITFSVNLEKLNFRGCFSTSVVAMETGKSILPNQLKSPSLLSYFAKIGVMGFDRSRALSKGSMRS